MYDKSTSELDLYTESKTSKIAIQKWRDDVRCSSVIEGNWIPDGIAEFLIE
jgi:hypothetical protein